MEIRPMRIRESSTAGQKFLCKYKSTLAACWTSGEETLAFPSSINKGMNNPNPITAKNRKIYDKDANNSAY
jgi:hypothetical protein